MEPENKPLEEDKHVFFIIFRLIFGGVFFRFSIALTSKQLLIRYHWTPKTYTKHRNWQVWLDVSRLWNRNDTVDGRNPAPTGIYKTLRITGYLYYINWLAGFLPPTVFSIDSKAWWIKKWQSKHTTWLHKAWILILVSWKKTWIVKERPLGFFQAWPCLRSVVPHSFVKFLHQDLVALKVSNQLDVFSLEKNGCSKTPFTSIVSRARVPQKWWVPKVLKYMRQ